MSCGDVFLALIAVIFPPLAVWVKTGLCSASSCINILLCILGYIPGLIHAWYIIVKYPEHEYERIDDPERQRVTYYVISHDTQGNHGRREQRQHGGRGYGTARGQHKNSSHHNSHHHHHVEDHHHHQHVQYVPSQHAHTLPPQQQITGVVRNDAAPSGSRPAQSSSAGAPPPSYNEAVRGDHKIQS